MTKRAVEKRMMNLRRRIQKRNTSWIKLPDTRSMMLISMR